MSLNLAGLYKHAPSCLFKCWFSTKTCGITILRYFREWDLIVMIDKKLIIKKIAQIYLSGSINQEKNDFTCLTAKKTFSSWESISVNVLICARLTFSL